MRLKIALWVWGIGVSAFFGIGLAITPVPEEYRTAAMIGAWSCFGLCCLGWFNAFFGKSKHPITIEYGKSLWNLVAVTVINKGPQEVRVLSVVMHLLDQRGHMKAIVSDDTLNKALRIKSFKRCAGLPHVMPPSSSFEAEYYLSDGTFTAHNLSGFYVTVKMEDGTVIKGERKLVKPSSHTQS